MRIKLEIDFCHYCNNIIIHNNYCYPLGTNIFVDGLPHVVPIGRNSSYPSSNHVPATFVVKEFGFKHSAAGCNGSEPDESLIWTQHNHKAKKDSMLEWNVEASLVPYVMTVLEDIFYESSELTNVYVLNRNWPYLMQNWQIFGWSSYLEFQLVL